MRFLTLICCFLAASVAMAHDFNVGVVDMQKLFNDYPGTKKAQNKFKDMMDKKKQELQETVLDLQDQEKQLKDSASIMSKTELKKKATELSAKEKAFSAEQDQAQSDFAVKQQEMSKTLLGEIKEIVAKVAKNKGIDLVLDNSSQTTVYVKDATDLTDEILKSYSKDSASSDSGK